MSDEPVRTHVEVAGAGSLAVPGLSGQAPRPRPRPRASASPASRARAPRARRARPRCAAADAIILPPSNPIVSIGPILALPGVRAALRRRRARVAAVSPLVRGLPIKGPLDRMLRGLGHEVSAVGVARLYRDLVDRLRARRARRRRSRRASPPSACGRW